MKFIVITGPQAVGKMTVGQSLSQLTGFTLYHNHMSVDACFPVFNHNPREGLRLLEIIREYVFTHFFKSEEKGLIFTCVVNPNRDYDIKYLLSLRDMARLMNVEFYLAELTASVTTRLERNITENRLKYKPSKRDAVRSTHLLLEEEKEGSKSEYLDKICAMNNITNFLSIDTENIDAAKSAEIIYNTFKLGK